MASASRADVNVLTAGLPTCSYFGVLVRKDQTLLTSEEWGQVSCFQGRLRVAVGGLAPYHGTGRKPASGNLGGCGL